MFYFQLKNIIKYAETEGKVQVDERERRHNEKIRWKLMEGPFYCPGVGI
jgi:hypothetical protein